MIVIFDLNHVAYRCLYAARRDINDVGWQYFKHIMFNQVINTAKKFNADEVVLMVDDKDNWRKKVYLEYKENRKEARAKQTDIDWNSFFTSYREFVEEVKTYFPFYVLQQKYLEADDQAGIFAREWQSFEKIIVTSDTDYLQLLKYKNLKIYDPIKAKFLVCDDPIKELKIKILTGDAGDNVPSIKERVGEKTAEKIVNEGKLAEMFEDKTPFFTKEDGSVITFGEEYKERYKRNLLLIDLDKTPEALVKAFKNTIKSYEMPSGKEIFHYFSKNKFRELMRNIGSLDGLVKRIQENDKPLKDNFTAVEELFG
jgi:5'-3' exonuclease